MLFAARIVDGLSGGNITTARAYIADITTEENRAKAFGMLGAAFGLGFIVGPALGAAFSHISYTAPIWAAAAITVVAIAAGVVLAAGDRPPRRRRTRLAVARAGGSLRPRRTCACCSRSTSSTGRPFAVYQTTFALFGARRFGFDAAHTGYLLSAFGFLGVVVQGGLVGPIVRALGETRTLDDRAAVRGGRLGRERADALAAGLRRDAGARRARHRPVQSRR